MYNESPSTLDMTGTPVLGGNANGAAEEWGGISSIYERHQFDISQSQLLLVESQSKRASDFRENSLVRRALNAPYSRRHHSRVPSARTRTGELVTYFTVLVRVIKLSSEAEHVKA